MEKLDGKSMDLTQENIEALKQLFPEIVTEGKIDFDKLKVVLGEEVESRKEKYEFTWHGKTQSLKMAQKPSNGTLRPDKESSKHLDTTENIYIEGDNLEVLKLLQKSYFGKIKMIYIDPPYNTGNDFVYKDNFKDNIKNYKEITQQTTKANSETNGRYHTDWLNMMYPRLKLARNLLKEDGVIFISIDDNEDSNLSKLCNEVFGEENFVVKIPWVKRVSPANDSKWYSGDHEYVLIYAKIKDKWHPNRTKRTDEHDKYYKNSDNDPRGPWNSAAYTCNKSRSERPNLYYPITNPFTGEEIYPRESAVWAYSKGKHNDNVNQNLLYWGADGKSKSPRKKQFLTEAKNVVPRSYWLFNEVGSTQTATTDLRSLFDGTNFSYPKPVNLLLKAIYQATDSNSIILDFFSGSATTAHAVMKINAEDGGNRKFIMVQIPEKIDEESEIFKAGFDTICKIGKERIRRSGEKIIEETGKKDLDIGFKVFKLDTSNVKTWNPDSENLEEGLLEQLENIKDNRTSEDLLFEILLKIGIPLTTPIEHIVFNNKIIYNVAYGSVLLCLENEINMNDVNEIIKNKSEVIDTKVIFKDSGFLDDSVKTNAMQMLKKSGINDVRSV